jgi:hypothetical protein
VETYCVTSTEVDAFFLQEATMGQVMLKLDPRQAALTAMLWEREARGHEGAGMRERRPRVAFSRLGQAAFAWRGAAELWAAIADTYAACDPEQYALNWAFWRAAQHHAERCHDVRSNRASSISLAADSDDGPE